MNAIEIDGLVYGPEMIRSLRAESAAKDGQIEALTTKLDGHGYWCAGGIQQKKLVDAWRNAAELVVRQVRDLWDAGELSVCASDDECHCDLCIVVTALVNGDALIDARVLDDEATASEVPKP